MDQSEEPTSPSPIPLDYANPKPVDVRKPRVGMGICSMIYALMFGFLSIVLLGMGIGVIQTSNTTHSFIDLMTQLFIAIVVLSLSIFSGWFAVLSSVAGIRRITGKTSLPESWKHNPWLPFADFE